jgi:hypothetical protein
LPLTSMFFLSWSGVSSTTMWLRAGHCARHDP